MCELLNKAILQLRVGNNSCTDYDSYLFSSCVLGNFYYGYSRTFSKPTKFCSNVDVHWIDVVVRKYTISDLELATGRFEWKVDGIVGNDLGLGRNRTRSLVVCVALPYSIDSRRRIFDSS